jgi:hypothetical protein
MSKRKTVGTVIASLVIGAAALPLAAFAAANTSGLKGINLQGVGVGALAAGNCATPAIACAPTHTCECLTGGDTVIQFGGQTWNKGSFTFELSIDETSSPLPVSTAGDCLPATGFGTLKNSNGKVTLLMDVTGLACPTTEGAAEVFNGTYHVTGGSGGKTPATHGTGSINGSLETTVSRITIDGNTQP